MSFNVPDELSFEVRDNQVKFTIGDLSTNWMSRDDSFIKRIDKDNLNQKCIIKHLSKEIEIKNILDEGTRFLNLEKYSKAIESFDDVLFYDPEYGEALLNKSYALYGQKHFVKSFRHYKRAVKADSNLKNIEYHKLLLAKSNEERDHFPKLKLNIYAGDEYFSKGEYKKAVDSYNRALANPSKFKDKILSKLFNKKATALLKLNDFDGALSCFKESLKVENNDYAIYGKGFCEYELRIDVDDDFKTRLNITKRQMLCQVSILNELGYFGQSLEICEFLLKNHFKEDDYYFKLIKNREFAIDNLKS